MIKLFLSDIDGTLTDGGIYYSAAGEAFKKFNLRDGLGFSLLKKRNIMTGAITSENSEINQRRFKGKLDLDFLIQGQYGEGKLDSVKTLCETLGIHLREVAYIGDDINCLNLLENVGFPACPFDAIPAVANLKNIYRCQFKGGNGCVREFINFLLD